MGTPVTLLAPTRAAQTIRSRTGQDFRPAFAGPSVGCLLVDLFFFRTGGPWVRLLCGRGDERPRHARDLSLFVGGDDQHGGIDQSLSTSVSRVRR